MVSQGSGVRENTEKYHLLLVNKIAYRYGMVENVNKNFFEELTSKLKLERMSRYHSGKEKVSILSKENNSMKQRFRGMKPYTTGRESVTVRSYLYYFKATRYGKESENNIMNFL